MVEDLSNQAAALHLSEPATLKVDEDSSDADGVSEEDGVVADPSAQVGGEKKKKKKKKKKKRKPKAKATAPEPETPEQTSKWKEELRKGRPTIEPPLFGLLDPSWESNLNLLLTPSCLSLSLETPRLLLRPARSSDLDALKRIKLEPTVQKTQLYGSPQAADIRDAFLNRYIRSCIPRLSPQNNRSCRDDIIFALTLKNHSSITIKPGDHLLPSSRIKDATGYIGNIALHLKPSMVVRNYNTRLFPVAGKPFYYPTFETMSSSRVMGELFYEIHPQLWGQGIMGEAFAEMLRFAFEEVGVTKIAVDPTDGNEASIKLALKNGLKYTHTAAGNPYRKPQLFHSITREEWWARNRPSEEIKGKWEGKEVCRWCMNFRLPEPTVACDGCKWAKYCSRECQRADWVLRGGHQVECGKRAL